MTKERIIELVDKYGPEYVQVDYPEFLNTTVHGAGLFKSRYIASWANAGGKFNDGHFYEWLLSIEFDDGHMSEEEADEIYNFAREGKMEFEDSAEKFLANL